MKVPLLDLDLQYDGILDEIKTEINDVIATHRYIMGPKISEFESQIEEFLNVKHAIACASGSDALVLALRALGLKKGDEVITVPFTFFATCGAIERIGAKTVFVDIDKDTFNMSPDKLEEALTENTKAIIPVHLFGQPAEMDKIMDFAKKHNLYVIEDTAQGIGSLYQGKAAGTIGDIGTLSFFPSKNLGAMGDAGMCLTNNDELAKDLRQMRVHGEDPKYFHKFVGMNSRMDTLQAAVLSVKLKKLKGWTELRRKNAEYYYKHLKDVDQIQLPVVLDDAYMIYNQFTIRTDKRDELMCALKDANIGCAVYYPLALHLQECFDYLGYKEGDFPESEKASHEVLSIPIFSELTEAQMDYVIKTIKDFFKK